MVVEGKRRKDYERAHGATRVATPVGTIRGDFAFTDTENVVHGSDSPENAELEINRFFRYKVPSKV